MTTEEEPTDDTEVATETDSDLWDRTTAPQSPYTSSHVLTGLIVFVIGLGITFGIPLLLT